MVGNMAEIKTELKTYRVEYICDECKKGEMIYNNDDIGIDFMGLIGSGKIEFSHVCNKCKCRKGLKEIYPKIAYEEKEGICL